MPTTATADQAALLEERFKKVQPKVEACSLRFMEERHERISVRQDVPEPVVRSTDGGVMVTVVDKGGLGYAATSDLSEAGLRRAFEQATRWAHATAGRLVLDTKKLPRGAPKGEYQPPVAKPWRSMSLGDKLALLRKACAELKVDPRIVDWEASLWSADVETLLLTSDGGRVHQRFEALVPGLRASANAGTETQRRTFGGSLGRQGGLEVLDQTGFYEAPARVGREVIELLLAPDCPTGTKDLLLAPDQMVLQIHESIGHPLELDRILGDERNYAGTSFVTLDMFGKYQYGSELLNVTFDPLGRAGELASYAFDDEGTPATREYIIEKGLLMRPLGGATSQARSGSAGVANARATSWNRPPIDRMANLNVEPGDAPLPKMIAAVKDGVFMETNISWSIDDSRNKFQFSCERGRVIRDGKLAEVVKNCSYRGISAEFWRNLAMVGDASTFTVMGVPNCGKGEPNQMVRVGHASPACLFTGVEVFGGAK